MSDSAQSRREPEQRGEVVHGRQALHALQADGHQLRVRRGHAALHRMRRRQEAGAVRAEAMRADAVPGVRLELEAEQDALLVCVQPTQAKRAQRGGAAHGGGPWAPPRAH